MRVTVTRPGGGANAKDIHVDHQRRASDSILQEWRSPIAPRTCLATNAPTVASKNAMRPALPATLAHRIASKRTRREVADMDGAEVWGAGLARSRIGRGGRPKYCGRAWRRSSCE